MRQALAAWEAAEGAREDEPEGQDPLMQDATPGSTPAAGAKRTKGKGKGKKKKKKGVALDDEDEAAAAAAAAAAGALARFKEEDLIEAVQAMERAMAMVAVGFRNFTRQNGNFSDTIFFRISNSEI